MTFGEQRKCVKITQKLGTAVKIFVSLGAADAIAVHWPL